jgi:Domain of unknown function (DUF4145)
LSDDATIQFIKLFAKLTEWVDDDPMAIPTCTGEFEFVALCMDLSAAYMDIEFSNKQRKMFLGAQDTKYIKRLREYESRYKETIEWACLQLVRHTRKMCEEFIPKEVANFPFEEVADLFEKMRVDSTRFIRDNVEENNLLVRETLGYVIELFAGKRKRNSREEKRSYFAGAHQILGIIEQLDLKTGESTERLKLAPNLLVAREIARRFHNSRQMVFCDLFNQAVRSYVVGAKDACLALMRSIVEVVLTDIYGSKGCDLSEKIRLSSNLPANVDKNKLHNLRRLANQSLHSSSCETDVASRDDQLIEEEMADLLSVVRDLIEGAPLWRTA